MKKSIIFILLSTMVMNSQAITSVSKNNQSTPPEQEIAAELVLSNLYHCPITNQALDLGLTAGSIGTATGISAGIITCKLLNKLPIVSDYFIGKLCIIGISGTVAWKAGKAATHRSLIELIKLSSKPEADAEGTSNP